MDTAKRIKSYVNSKMLKWYIGAITPLLLSTVADATPTANDPICSVLPELNNASPTLIEIIAFVIGFAGVVVGALIVIDRDKGSLGRGLLIIMFSILIFAVLWAFSQDISPLLTNLQGSLCSST